MGRKRQKKKFSKLTRKACIFVLSPEQSEGDQGVASSSITQVSNADGNGELTTNDSLDIMRIVLGVAEPTDGISSSCDMNGDGVIDMADALLILRIAVGIQSAD